MAADERDLVHGGFTFGLADYAAMLAVNDPNVVLGAAQVRFTGPVKVGEALVARAEVQLAEDKKRQVECSVSVGDQKVFQGTFTCFILGHHIFDQ
ncbi:MaoC/PaaZ C-terminal domain-containing protein [Geoalkalibacter subterraneus]|uniref:MaoC/PaaZ C-terminal domain-containing protein n=1 Tax=Geoalkalibacter subterraneus TaxID=483547 RepID=UPI000A05DF0C|nr:MaoC/PaaZ C-terminal domain-containing protein [Geoalkalibacter subterraneus]